MQKRNGKFDRKTMTQLITLASKQVIKLAWVTNCRLLLIMFLLPVPLLVSLAAYGGSITTAEIVSSTSSAALSCMRWRPVGLCFWLRCTLSGCEVRSSLKVGHYRPDAVVSSYNELGGNPWVEIAATLGLAQQKAASGLLGSLLTVPLGSAGNSSEGANGRRNHRNLVFREADVIGHPLQSLSTLSVNASYLCQPQTTAMYPYFQSGLDALAWRLEVPEGLYPASLIAGLREIGRWPLQSWGGVYPRTGWTMQTEEPKAAAITAQRAGDIVTRSGQPHIYVPMTGSSDGGQQVWPPGPLLEGDEATGVWQMLLPKVDSGCGVFGSNDLTSANGWGGGRVDPGGDYAWTLWRPYLCCEDRGSFLFDINWTSYP